MEESKRQDHPEDGSRRFAKAIKIVWERPGNSPSFGEISAIYEQRSNDLEGQIKKSNDYGEAML